MAHIVTNPSAVLVPPAAPKGGDALTNDIRDIRPPQPIRSVWSWVLWTTIVLVLIILAVWAWRRWRKAKAALAIPPAVPAHVRARQRLQAALRFLGDPRQFCFEISEALRWYLEERFTLRAPERTTEEFLLELQRSRELLPDQKQSLAEFLEACDLVKFARHEPTELALRDLHERALRLVEETQYEPVRPESAAPVPVPATPP